MEMLAVNIEQQFAERFELLHRDGVAINKCPRTAIGFDDASQKALAVLIQCLRIQPGTNIR